MKKYTKKDHCYCCGRKLRSDNTIFLEQNKQTGEWRMMYDNDGQDWSGKTTGFFEFGRTCGLKIMEEQTH